MTNVLRYLKDSITSGHAADSDPSEFVDYKKVGRVGFPQGVVAVAHDPKLGLQALGTDDGFIHIIGGGNVHWIAQVPQSQERRRPVHIYSVYGKGVFMILCSDATIFRLTIRGVDITIEAIRKEFISKDITAAAILQADSRHPAYLLIGTSGGNVFSIDTMTLKCAEFMPFSPPQSVTDASQVTVAYIAGHRNCKHVAVLFSDNRLVVYDSSLNESSIHHIDVGVPTGLFYGSNDVLYIPFSDGSFREFSGNKLGLPVNTFGPFPASPITKIGCAVLKRDGQSILIFAGGMPSAAYGDRFTVTIKSPTNILCLDFGSEIVSFDISVDHDGNGYDSCLIVVTKSELVVIDLSHPKWHELPCRSFYPMDAHSITSSIFVSDVSKAAWTKLTNLSKAYWASKSNVYSMKSSALFAYLADSNYQPENTDSYKNQLLITGHDDGSVNIWTAGEKCSELLFSISTAAELQTDTLSEAKHLSEDLGGSFSTDFGSQSDSEEPGVLVNVDDEWPPFRKVGVYDPFCDERRAAIQKMYMDSTSADLCVGTVGGLVFVYQLREEVATLSPFCSTINLVKDSKLRAKIQGTEVPALIRTVPKAYSTGYQPFMKGDVSVCFQMMPSHGITAVSLLSARNLLVIANEFGIAIVHLLSGDVLLNTSYIDHEEIANAHSGNVWAIYKSMKQSVRKTFRRKKKSPTADLNLSSLSAGTNASDVIVATEDEFRPIERKIEARPTTSQIETKAYLVRTVAFLKTPLTTGSVADTLWVGLNGGRVLCYSVVEKPREPDSIKLERELMLTHAAPVLYFNSFTDISNRTSPQQRLLIVTEEQIRVYSLPTMKTLKFKAKITSTEGYRIRKAALVNLHSSKDLSISHAFIAVLTNAGELRVYSPVSNKKKVRIAAINANDQVGISSTIFSSAGDVLFLRCGQSEYQRAVLSSHSVKWTEPFEKSTWPANN